ncbi:MAG: class II aldolase/adducin family protein [Planctomycetes bacterium]|nr:class II aldolase/adducin family protein [Planctomycetota bacterium]
MPKNTDLTHPRDEIMQTMERIYRYRMTTTSGGNLSIREADGDTWISPARIDKGNLTRNDIVCVHADGSVNGTHRPSSEFPFHRAIYACRPDLRGIVHAHPVALVAFSICRALPNTRLFHQAHSVCGETGFAPYALPGSERLADHIATAFASGLNCVILENHGVVVGGDSLSHAYQRFEALEFAAKTIIKARLLGDVRYLTDTQLALAERRSVNLTASEAPSASSTERELRRQLCEFVRRGCRQRLLISTEGSFSARLDEDSFLITPSQQDRFTLDVNDLVLVRGDTCSGDSRPSRATLAHREIYRRHPDIKAVVFAHPVNATAFSVTNATLDARTIPESYIFLRDVARVPYGIQYQPDGPIAEYLSARSPAALLENDGVVVVGTSILDAFDRLEVLETTSEAIINSRLVGDITPMTGDVIDELKAAFLKE